MTNEHTIQVLSQAKDTLSDASKWTQGAVARDKHGEEAHFNSPDAVCWCILGAIYKASWKIWDDLDTRVNERNKAVDAVGLVAQARGRLSGKWWEGAAAASGLNVWNDLGTITHDCVIETLSEAIADLK